MLGHALTIFLLPCNISGAIHPSVPLMPDLLNDDLPVESLRHSPKSDIIARTHPLGAGKDSNTFRGFISRCTMKEMGRLC